MHPPRAFPGLLLHSTTSRRMRQGNIQEPISIGCRVRLRGLSTAALNGAQGSVVGKFDAESGRWPVLLFSPENAAGRTDGIKVKPENLEVLLSTQMAVQIIGADAEMVQLTGHDAKACAALADGWFECPVPKLLGLPLAMKQLGKCPHHPQENLAVLMTIDPVTGFAPDRVLCCGLGKVLVARTDGKDFTLKEMWSLYAYNRHLMDIWDDERTWCEAERLRALTPAAYRSFTQAHES